MPARTPDPTRPAAMRPALTQEVIDLYDRYTHAPLDRRDFLRRLAMIAGSVAAAQALLPLLENNYARAATVAEDDPRLATETVTIATAHGDLSLYVVRPAGAGALPAVVVVHENRGLNPHTRDIARRLALESYIAIAPDFLSLGGGATPADEDRARAMIGALDAGQVRDAAVAALAYGRGGRPDTTGRTAITGFCWGGRVANDAAVADAALDAAVPFYGSQPPAAAASQVRARLLLHYAGEDQRINAGIRDWTEALAAAGVAYEMHMYEDAQHAFMNDTNAARYNADAAALAWQRTIAFLDSALKG